MTALVDRGARGGPRDRVVRAGYRWGWRYGARVPAPVVRGLVAGAAEAGLRRGGIHVRTLRHNLGVAAGAPADDRLVRAALRSHLRMLTEQLTLPGWPAERIERTVVTVNGGVLQTAYGRGGAVVALPHSGNWDLAGAWALHAGMPVTTVAERLGDEEYAAFVAFRERFGMQVLSHRDVGTIGQLAIAVRANRLVCLLADRDLTGGGLSVSWHDRTVRMPAGPALVARRTGAALIPAVCRYRSEQMEIVFGDPVPPRPGREGLTAMTQDVAAFFADRIAEQPQDWHMFQPFFGAPG